MRTIRIVALWAPGSEGQARPHEHVGKTVDSDTSRKSMAAPLRNNLHTQSHRCESSNPATVRSSTRAPCTVLRSPNRCQRESRSPPVAGTQRYRNLLPQWQPRMHTLGERGPFGPSYTKLSRAKLMMEERAEWFPRVLLQHDTAELMRAQQGFWHDGQVQLH